MSLPVLSFVRSFPPLTPALRIQQSSHFFPVSPKCFSQPYYCLPLHTLPNPKPKPLLLHICYPNFMTLLTLLHTLRNPKSKPSWLSLFLHYLLLTSHSGISQDSTQTLSLSQVPPSPLSPFSLPFSIFHFLPFPSLPPSSLPPIDSLPPSFIPLTSCFSSSHLSPPSFPPSLVPSLPPSLSPSLPPFLSFYLPSLPPSQLICPLPLRSANPIN